MKGWCKSEHKKERDMGDRHLNDAEWRGENKKA